MPASRLPIRIFISSPGDVGDERRRASLVISRLAREYARFFDLSPVLWEYEPMLAAGTFQDVITPPRDTDIVVVVVWSRLGTALPAPYASPIDGRAPVTGTEWEYEDAKSAFDRTGTPDVLVYRNDAVPRVDARSPAQLQEASRQLEAVEAFWGRHFVNAAGEHTVANARYATLDDFSERLERDLRGRLRKRLDELRNLGRAQPAWLEGSPYLGLRSFDLAHAAIFFGRSLAQREVTEALLRRAARPGAPAFCMILGASGSGKSSLARAGVLPDLMAPGMVAGVDAWRHVVFRPQENPADPCAGLARALHAALPELADIRFAEADTARLFAAADESALLPVRNALLDIGERMSPGRLPLTVRLAVLVDQFEELFTGAALTPQARGRFIDLLGVLARSGLVCVLATMRSEFYPQLATGTLRELAAGDGQYLLGPPSAAELDEMIRLPAAAAEIDFAPDQDGIGLDARLRDDAARDPHGLPLLAFALDRLYRLDVDRDGGRVLTYASYAAIGGLRGAIATHAEAVLGSLPGTVADAFAEVVPQLVTIDPASETVAARTAPRHEIEAPGTAGAAERAALLDALVGPEGRLLVSDAGPDGAVLRLAHEALIAPGNWPRIGAIIEQQRGFLRDRARVQAYTALWEAAGKPDDRLLAGARPLAEARDLLAHRLPAGLRDFIDRSLAAEAARLAAQRNEERRRTTRLLRLAVAAAAVFAVLGAAAVWQWREADKAALAARAAQAEANESRLAEEVQRRSAEANARSAMDAEAQAEAQRKAAVAAATEAGRRRDWALANQSLYLARQSIDARQRGSARTGVALALEGLPQDLREPDRPVLEEAVSALSLALAEDRQRMAIAPGGDGLMRAAASPDGRHVLSYGKDGKVVLWDVASASAVATLPAGPRGRFDGPLFFPDGARFVLLGADRSVQVRETARPAIPIARFSGHMGGMPLVLGFALSGDGEWVASSQAVALNQTRISVWHARTGDLRAAFDSNMFATRHMLLNHDGSRMLALGPQDQLLLFDVDGGLVIQEYDGRHAQAAHAFTPDGKGILIGTEIGEVQLVDASDGTFRASIVAHDSAVTAVSFAGSKDYILTGSADRTVKLWTADLQGPALKVFTHHQHPVTAIAVADGGLAVASSDRETAHVWRIDDGLPARRFGVGPGPIDDMALATDATQLFLVDANRSFRSFDLGVPDDEPVIDTRGPVSLLAFTSDRRIAVTGNVTGDVALWDVASGSRIAAWRAHRGALTGLSFSADAATLLTASHDGRAALWTLPYGRPLWDSTLHPGQVRAQFMPDGSVLTRTEEDWQRQGMLTRDWTAPLRILHRQTGEETAKFAGHAARVTAAVPVQGGRSVLSGDENGVLVLWRSDDGTERRRFSVARGGGASGSHGFSSLIALPDPHQVLAWGSTAVAILDIEAGTARVLQRFPFVATSIPIASPALGPGAGLAVVTTVSQVSAWRLPEGTRLWTHRAGGEAGTFTSPIALDETGAFAAVGTNQGFVQVLDTSIGAVLRNERLHHGPVRRVDFSGGQVISAGDDGRVMRRALPLAGQDLLDFARATTAISLGQAAAAAYGIRPYAEASPGAAPGGTAAERCEAHARPVDGTMSGPQPVRWDDIDVPAAEAACRAALAETPDSPRLKMLLALALVMKPGAGEEAVAALRAASAAGDMRALTYLADELASGALLPRNLAEATRLYLRAAEAGDVAAMVRVGDAYRAGDGIAADATEARQWYAQAASAGYPFAMTSLGDLLATPTLPFHDPAESFYWHARAAAAFGRMEGFWREAQGAAQSRGNAAWRLAPEVVLREFRRARQDDAAR
jgi:WD40 repeat protein